MAKSAGKGLLGLAVIAAIGVGVAFVVMQARNKKEVADATFERMQHEIDELDPATRLMVRARLLADSVRGTK
jgi:uncharacterized protein HemX